MFSFRVVTVKFKARSISCLCPKSLKILKNWTDCSTSFLRFIFPLLIKLRRTPLLREHSTTDTPFLCSGTNPSLTRRWPKDKKKNVKIYSIGVLFSSVLWNQLRKHHNVQSETRKLSQGANENSDKKTRRLPEARENVNGLSAKKKTTATTKPVLSSATDDIQQTPVTPNTFSCPKYCERRIPCEKCHFPKHLTCEVKGRVSLNTLWVLGMMSCARWVTFPALGLCCHGDAESCAHSLSISVPRSLMIVITGAAFRLSRERKMAFRRYSVCWLCNSSRLFSWISEIKNCCEQRSTF